MKRSRVPFFTTITVLVFFYLPLIVLSINSFNDSRYGGPWKGFTFRWYVRLFHDPQIWHALKNTLLIAVSATLVSMMIGTLAAFALHRYRSRLQMVHYGMIYSPLIVPDILMGMSLLLFFVALKVKLGLFTIFIAHVTFCLSYVTMVVLSRLQDFDFSLIEAAQDLGANGWTAFRRILLPLIMPGIAAGGLLAFTLSLDDFVITFFVSGPGSTTLPIHIYSMMKHGAPAVINALSVILLLITFVLVSASRTMREKTE
ncbi:MAG: spermidine/putrescine transport system permease protein [Verrucomicrobiota bacterium]|jgi:spermidine/putrescine transport system permease protein|nr:spermidine/putrescine transport system permease protein [Verrucomicrobiota bacterium]MDK2964095.1 spermidine/putrescine transport system permease protein [Verrucomicrobiota bacterium]